MVDYCDFHINRLRKFELLSLSTETIMRKLKLKEFERDCLMDIDEYSKDFETNFPELDLKVFENEEREKF